MPSVPRVPAPSAPAPSVPAEALRRYERSENFPVALRVLPARYRDLLRAVYDVVRTIDQIGDAATGDRTAALYDVADDLTGVWSGRHARSPVIARLVAAGATERLPLAPFTDLVAANLQDQVVQSYDTLDDVLGYCALSAAPIGRLVLAVFEVDDERAPELSDRVCAALQLLEHWQDVGEDRRAGRVYLPQEDLAAWGVAESDLDAPAASDRLRRLVIVETERAESLLAADEELLPRLRGWARVAVAGYAAGGHGAADAIRRCRGDVLRYAAHTRSIDVARHATRLLRRAA
jgi:squalene synthase HpnC